MNTSLGATTPSSSFKFFNGAHNNGDYSTINIDPVNASSKSAGEQTSLPGNRRSPFKTASNRGPSKKPSARVPDKLDRGKQKSNRNMKPHLSQQCDAKIGPLVADPSRFGFDSVAHKLRPMPRFLIDQQAQLKPEPFKQDPWDKANQDKMLKLENSIMDVADLYETLKKMRDMERKMMESKGLVDKADSAKDLTDAINFQGTCQDMCPIFERARRNVEYTVYSYEKDDPNGKKASRMKALKVFARPAAAAAPPLPSDVRPPHILSKTLDYIVDNLLVTLPDGEGFIWDRMRSIRQDFTYQNYSGPEAIDCNERIVRIHLLIIHIMGKSNAEFSLQQELEQLHKSLITLSEIYDEVRANGGCCPNEAEFRAYALLSKIRDPEYDKNIQELPSHIFQDSLVQMALCFRRMISNSNFHKRGYIRTENCLNFYNAFFQILASGKIPFLMSSFLELYVNEVRFYAFKALSLSINKRHKPIPTEHMKQNFLFNDDEELEKFCNYYSIDINDEGVELKTLLHQSHKLNETQPLKQASLRCIDQMILGIPFHKIINVGEPNVDSIPNKELARTNNSQKVLPEIGEGELEQEKEMVQSADEIDDRDDSPNNNHDIAKPNAFRNSLFNTKTSQAEKLPGTDLPPSLPSGFSFQNKVSNEMPTKGLRHDAKFTIFGTKSDALSSTRNPISDNSYHHTEDRTTEEEFLTSSSSEKKREIIKTEVGMEEKEKEERKRTFDVETEKIKTNTKLIHNISSNIIQNVVHKHVSEQINDLIEKDIIRKRKVNKLTEELYLAFLHEKIHEIHLDSTAEEYHQRKLKTGLFHKWKIGYRTKKEEKEEEKKRKAVFQNVGRLLGVPLRKKSKVFSTPKNYGVPSFILPSSLRKDITLSPVLDEANIFSKQAEKRKEVWEPMDLGKIYFQPLRDKSNCFDHQVVADVFIYGSNWSSIPNNWVMNKFGITAPSNEKVLQDEFLAMKIRCIDLTYDPASFVNLQLLVFNTGVTDSNIFDLEMKLQHDGEELIKLVTGVSLNTNITFSLIILYWESSETPLSDSTIFKCLKLNRISKSFFGILEDINIVTISGSSPHSELEKGLGQVAQRFHYKLTERGKYHTSMQQRRTLIGLNPQATATQAIDAKMKRMLESEQDKYKEEEDQRNTYAHLKSHMVASPRFEKKKLPVLLSKRKDYKFKTPLAVRSLSSSSPVVPSHLATKMRRAPRVPSYHGVLAGGTPSHSTNLPVISTNTGSLLNSALDNSQLSNLSFEHPTVIHEPALYQTPINSTASISQKHDETPQNPNESIQEEVLELQDLIESVKRRVNNHQDNS